MSRVAPAILMAVDISAASLEQARARIAAAGLRNVEFHTANLFDLPFGEEHFDHVFLCFLLEHVAEPAAALRAIKLVLGRGRTITVIEGDHGSWYCHPRTPDASRVVQCLVDVQARLGGDALIGRRLYPLLTGRSR